jgi:phosphoglycerol transferase
MTTSLLYAFLPLHFHRGEPHLFLSAYYVVPLAALMTIWLMGDEPPGFGPSAGRLWANRRGAAALVVALLLGVSGVYYAYFACFFLLIAGVTGSARRHDLRGFAAAGVIIAAVVGSSALALGPSVLHQARAGRNPAAVQRSPIEAEIYGLKLDALLLPVEGHRLSVMEYVRRTYLGMVEAVGPTWNNEATQSAGIGVVGGSGFLLLLAWLFVGRSRWALRILGDRRELVDKLAGLNIAGVLLATVRGAGAAIALVLPQIRAYNRISVYLAFFALAAVAIFLDAAFERVERKVGPWAAAALALSVAGVGLLDQVPKPDPGAAARNAWLFGSDHRFVESIERLLGPGRAVFQLPHVPFPESQPVYRLTDYQHFRAYLHSRDTRWSYGAVKGRPTAEWQSEVSTVPLDRMLPELKRAGFSGLWIGLRGFPDRGSGILAQAQDTLGTKPIQSETGEFAFFLIP